jgi:hypothetical protein
LLDFFVSSGLGAIHSSANSFYDLSSDHNPVLFTLNLSPIYSPRPPTLTPGPMDWDKIQVVLESKISLHIPLKTPDDVDSTVHSFTEVIQQSAWDSSVPSHSNRLNSIPQYLPQHIRILISAKRRAHTAWQKS